LLSPSAESVLEVMLRLGRGGYSYSGEQSPSSGTSYVMGISSICEHYSLVIRYKMEMFLITKI